MTLDSRSKYKQSHEYSNVCALHENPVLLAVISRKICIRCDVELCAVAILVYKNNLRAWIPNLESAYVPTSLQFKVSSTSFVIYVNVKSGGRSSQILIALRKPEL